MSDPKSLANLFRGGIHVRHEVPAVRDPDVRRAGTIRRPRAFPSMPRRKRRRPPTPLPFMVAELALASWETASRRMLLMLRGACTPAEYARMVLEKAAAAQASALALSRKRTRRNPRSVIGPWHRGASANAKRLRKG
jgi:hypothetical protein